MFEGSIPPSPMAQLMRECINTPCRGSDLDLSDLIDVIGSNHIKPYQSAMKRSARSPTKKVNFDIASLSNTEHYRTKSLSPRKALSVKDENARPKTADNIKQVKHVQLHSSDNPNGRRALPEEPDCDIVELANLRNEVEHKDLEIARLKRLLDFALDEVKIYRRTHDTEVAQQAKEIATLRRQLYLQ